MSLEKARDMLALALIRYAEQSFADPNCLDASASPGYLEDHFGGPPAHLAGRVGRRFLTSLQLHLAGRLIVRYELRGDVFRYFIIRRPS